MADTSRIEQLRRRVEADPASFAFAALAEEYRKAGRHREAVDTCRAGLRRHPEYTSARATLGRALLDTDQVDAAARELERVLAAAPENLAALRGLADVHRRRGETAVALEYLERAALLVPQDQDLREEVARARAEASASPDALPAEGPADNPVVGGEPAALSGDRPVRADLARQIAALEGFLSMVQRHRLRAASVA
jgi:tetratricopeptide (TPR) repeat protein